jgi:hypothetical protein
LIPNLAAAGPGRYLPVNSLLIRGREPIIIDTGAPVHRLSWVEQVFSLVNPEDVRWIFFRTTTVTTSAGSPTPWRCARRRRW